MRDYIHVVDLAQGHVAAIDKLDALPGCTAINLGTGRGYSVLEMVAAAREASGREIPYAVAARRPGDIATCYADPVLRGRGAGLAGGPRASPRCAPTTGAGRAGIRRGTPSLAWVTP